MARYEIKRWDPIIFGESVHPLPTISIKPDKEFIEFANKNLNTVIVRIEGSGTIYDGKAMVGIVNASADKPVCTPVAFNKDKLYTVTLYAKWYGYPTGDNVGVAIITGLKGEKGMFQAGKVEVPPFKAPVPAFPMGDKLRIFPGMTRCRQGEIIGESSEDNGNKKENYDKGKSSQELYEELYTEPYCSDSLSTQQIGGIAIGLLVVFGVLFWISFSTKNNIQVR